MAQDEAVLSAGAHRAEGATESVARRHDGRRPNKEFATAWAPSNRAGDENVRALGDGGPAALEW